MATVLQAVIDTCLMAQVDLVAGDLGLSRSRCVRELVEWLVEDEELQARLRARLEAARQARRQELRERAEATESQRRRPGRPARSQAAQAPAPWLADLAWVRVTLGRVDPAVAGMSDERLREVSARGDVPAMLAAAWAAEHPGD